MTDLVSRDINWARKITERLRLQATNYQEAREKVLATLAEARDGGAAELLGYASWTAYMAEVFGDAPLRLERDARQELVAELAAEGMSTRAIAPIVGVSVGTVHADRQVFSSEQVTPEPQSGGVIHWAGDATQYMSVTAAEAQQIADALNRDEEPAPALVEASKKITGMDGKQYTRPEKKQNRRPLNDSANDAGWNLRKAMEKVERIREDDRYSRNKKEVAAHLRGHLMYVIETCQGFLDDIDQNEEN